MIPAAFDYEVAESADHAVGLLGERGGDAKLLAGGHSLIPAMRLRVARPALLVDIGRIAELSYVREEGEALAIGALTRHQDVCDNALLQAQCPIVAYTAGLIGDPQVRHRGTIGGTLAHGDPASDMPAVMLALDAELVVRGGDGERTIPASEFYTGLFQTAVGPAEMLVEVRVPKLGSSAGWSYVKMSRRAQDWATVGVAAVVEENGSRTARDRAHEHGRDADQGGCGGGSDRGRRLRRASCCAHRRGHRARARTTRRARTSAVTSQECSAGERSKRRRRAEDTEHRGLAEARPRSTTRGGQASA